MPICTNCHNKWSWKQTMKKMMTLHSTMNCPWCEKEQYQSKRSKTRASIFNLIVFLPLLIQAFFDVPGVILLSLIPVLVAIIFIFYPFLIELSSKEEFLF